MSRHLTANVFRLSAGLVLAILLLMWKPLNAAAQMAGHNHEMPAAAKPPSEPLPVSDQVTSIPYFTLRDGMSSHLTLFNAAPTPTPVPLTIFTPNGGPFPPPP